MKKKSRISNVCESIVMKIILFIIYYGERRKIKNYADFNSKIIHDLEEEESRITNHWNWLILIIKLSMSLTKIYNFVCSLAVFHLDKARKWRNNVSFLLNSRKTGSPPWLVLSRAIRSNVERCGRFSFRSLICFRTGKKKKKRRKGWHLAGTCYAHSSPLPASSHLPPLTRNLSCILFYCTISKLIYHPLNKPILFHSHEFPNDNFVVP